MLDTSTQPDLTRPTTDHWIRLARAGAVAMTVWMILLSVLARTVIPPVIGIGLIALLFAIVMGVGRRKTALGAAVFAIVALLGDVGGLIDDLANPESTPGFILTTLVVLGGFVLIVGGLGVFFGWSDLAVRPIATAVPVLGVVLALFSAMAGSAVPNVEAADTDVQVVMESVQFQPETVSADAGGTLWLDNRDGIRHTFTVEELGVNVDIPALKSARVDLDVPAGTYDVICDVRGHEHMTATLVVGG